MNCTVSKLTEKSPSLKIAGNQFMLFIVVGVFVLCLNNGEAESVAHALHVT